MPVVESQLVRLLPMVVVMRFFYHRQQSMHLRRWHLFSMSGEFVGIQLQFAIAGIGRDTICANVL